jgi:peroxiredoxin
MNNKLKYLILTLLGLLIGFYFYNKYKVPPSINFNKLTLFDTQGNPVKISDFKGKKLIVSFGASWCPNCIDELKMINGVKEKDLSDIEIIVISDEAMEKVQAFKERKGYPFTYLKMNETFNSIGINSIPTTYIVNPKQEVKDETVGFIDWEDASTIEHVKDLMD